MEKSYKRVENLSNYILDECEKRGFTIEELQILGRELPKIISVSLRKQLSQTTFNAQ